MVAVIVGLIVLALPSEVARQTPPERVLSLNPAPSNSAPAAVASGGSPSEDTVVEGGGGTMLAARPAPLDRPPPPTTLPAPAKRTETPSRDVERLPLADAPPPSPARQRIAAAPTAGPDEVASNAVDRPSAQPTENKPPAAIAADSASTPAPQPTESKTAAATTGASDAEPPPAPARDEAPAEPAGFQPPSDVSATAALRRLQNKTPYLPDVRLLLRPGTDGAGGRRAAASAYSTLRQAGFAVEDRRPGSVPPPYTVVRYFDPADAALAYDIAILLGGAPVDLSGVIEPDDRRIEVFLAE